MAWKRSTYFLYRYWTLDERRLSGDHDNGISLSRVYNNISQEKTGFKCHLLPVGMECDSEPTLCDMISSITHNLLFMDEINHITG